MEQVKFCPFPDCGNVIDARDVDLVEQKKLFVKCLCGTGVGVISDSTTIVAGVLLVTLISRDLYSTVGGRGTLVSRPSFP